MIIPEVIIVIFPPLRVWSCWPCLWEFTRMTGDLGWKSSSLYALGLLDLSWKLGGDAKQLKSRD